MNRSRTRTGAQPRITRYARNNRAGQIANPLTELPVYGGFWADDPAWTDNPGVGQAVSSWRNGGTLAASGAYLDPTLGLVLPGVAGNYASVPDEAALDITGDITLVARVALTDWTPAAIQDVIAKWNAPNASYRLCVLTDGKLRLQWTEDGTTALTADSSVAPTVANGATLWIASTLDVNNGAGGRTIRFWTSADGVTWAELGTPTSPAGVTSIASGTALLEFGARISGTSNPLGGALSVARVYSGSGFTTAGPSGTLVLNVDFRRTAVGAFTASTGQTVTVASTFNALQGTAGSRPTLTTSALLGGRRVVRGDGIDDRVEILTGVALNQPFEAWAIVVADTVSAAMSIIGLDNASNARLVGITATPNWTANMGSAVDGGTPATATPYLVRAVCDGASTTVYVNGVSVATGDAGANAVDQIVLFAARTAPSTYANHWDGDIAFAGLLPAASITATHRRQFALWAASFYSVPGFAAAA